MVTSFLLVNSFQKYQAIYRFLLINISTICSNFFFSIVILDKKNMSSDKDRVFLTFQG